MSKHITIFLLLIVAMVLAACAPAASRSYEQGLAIEAPAPAMVVESDLVAGAPPAEPKSSFAAQDVVAERLVIRNANLTLVVTDPAQSVAAISQMAQEMGGFVVSSNIYQTTYDDNILANRASITIRVPAEQLDEALSRIKQDAIEVRSENVSGQDVTQEYTDLQSQLRNLEAAEDELREIMKASTNAEYVLDVFEHLRQVRQEIEITKGRIQYYEQSARMSAISVDLLPDVATRPLQIGRWEPQGTAKAALGALINLLKYMADAAIWGLICVFPIAAILGVPAWFVVRAIRRRRKIKQDEPEAS